MLKRGLAIMVAALLPASGAGAQVVLDRADPTIIQRSAPTPPQTSVAPPTSVTIQPSRAAVAAPVTGVVSAITVVGQDQLPAAAFADTLATFVGQRMSPADLTRLAGAVADAARARGFPFASAGIKPQPLADGILRVTLDLGRVDAVRVIGARNAVADRLLQSALVTGRGVGRGALERAIALVGDLPGVRVTGSRYVRQDGFGILLLTIEQDRASAYLQLDNRGSDEIGPVRSTLLASVRGLAQPADELAILLAQTPIRPDEFAYLRARYSAAVDATGTVLSISGSIARSHPGGALKQLDIVGHSADAAVALEHPLLRGRARSLWASAELRTLGTDQRLGALDLRRDRLTTVAGALSGAARAAGGALRGDLTATVGLPFAGATREGAPLASRPDGDARFVTIAYSVEWTRSIGKPFSIVAASAGQLASRPLLATAEIGLGGPAFGRGYDYSERSGDQGVLGSLELRADAGRIARSVVDRSQLYGFVDGGVVRNLRGGAGGGALLSTGMGVRVGTGRFDWQIEAALPLNADRFDTGGRRPRISLRLARAF